MKKPEVQIKSRITKILLFILYCLILSSGIFYFRFPYTQTVKWIAALGDKNPHVFVSYNSLERKFPNRVKISGLTVYQVKKEKYIEIIRMPNAVFKMNPLSNKWVVGGITVTVALHLLIIYALPNIGFNPFRVEAFPAQWWAFIVLLAIPVVFLVELEEFLVEWLKSGTKRT